MRLATQTLVVAGLQTRDRRADALRLRLIATTVAAIVIGAAPLLACPVCFQVEQGPVTDGIRAAVLVLVGVTVVVLAGFVRFVVRFARRAETAA